jgi:hypothetical protein
MNRFWQRGISVKGNSLQQINSTGLWLNHPMPRMFSMHVFKFIFPCLMSHQFVEHSKTFSSEKPTSCGTFRALRARNGPF